MPTPDRFVTKQHGNDEDLFSVDPHDEFDVEEILKREERARLEKDMVRREAERMPYVMDEENHYDDPRQDDVFFYTDDNRDGYDDDGFWH